MNIDRAIDLAMKGNLDEALYTELEIPRPKYYGPFGGSPRAYGTESKIKEDEGNKYNGILTKHGWKKSWEKYPDSAYKHTSHPGHKVFLDGTDSSWAHSSSEHYETGFSHNDLDQYLSRLYGG